MKKTLLTALLGLTSLCAGAQSSPHALGVHFGASTLDIEYQYQFSQKNFLDVTAGIFDLDDGFVAQGIYNWNIKEWNWTPSFGVWKFWGGVGGGLGYYDHHNHNGMLLGPVGTLGFGFTLRDVPLTVGIDYRPWVAFVIGDDFDIVDKGFRNLGLTLTYRF